MICNGHAFILTYSPYHFDRVTGKAPFPNVGFPPSANASINIAQSLSDLRSRAMVTGSRDSPGVRRSMAAAWFLPKRKTNYSATTANGNALARTTHSFAKRLCAAAAGHRRWIEGPRPTSWRPVAPAKRRATLPLPCIKTAATERYRAGGVVDMLVSNDRQQEPGLCHGRLQSNGA